MIRAAIIGCGLIGQKRAYALPKNVELVGCYDQNRDTSNIFAKKHGTFSFESVSELMKNSGADFIFVCTTHDSLGDIALEGIEYNKNLFLEKPGAINANILKDIAKLGNAKKLLIHVGYNHGYHPAIRKAIETFRMGSIGPLMFLRARYGHGGRLGYEKEWRAFKEKSGGGELIDQGSHLIDIALMFLGHSRVDYAAVPTYFWEMGVEDNAFISLINNKGNIAFMHASCTEWKNTFSLEVYGERGKIEVSGLGRSYGPETFKLFKMAPEMGPPQTEMITFPDIDTSWSEEVNKYIADLENKTNFSDNLSSSISVLELINEVYAERLR
jgi:predicted dehydrogenase